MTIYILLYQMMEMVLQNTELSNATKPFYKSVYEKDNSHFGMGLNICKILCENMVVLLIL